MNVGSNIFAFFVFIHLLLFKMATAINALVLIDSDDAYFNLVYEIIIKNDWSNNKIIMSLLGESISALVAIKIKRRHDTITDQYNRIFMVKMTILFSAFIGFNYFQDKVSCIVANVNGMDGGFVGSACWIQGTVYGIITTS